MASFDSLVNGTFVEATWTMMTAGPFGIPDPPGWSRL